MSLANGVGIEGSPRVSEQGGLGDESPPSNLGGISSAGRAPGLQPGGHRFDPGILHQPSLASELRLASQTKVVRRSDEVAKVDRQ